MAIKYCISKHGSEFCWDIRSADGISVRTGWAKSKSEATKDMSEMANFLLGAPLNNICECGGKAVGFAAFQAGHSLWCPASSNNFEYQEVS